MNPEQARELICAEFGVQPSGCTRPGRLEPQLGTRPIHLSAVWSSFPCFDPSNQPRSSASSFNSHLLGTEALQNGSTVPEKCLTQANQEWIISQLPPREGTRLTSTPQVRGVLSI